MSLPNVIKIYRAGSRAHIEVDGHVLTTPADSSIDTAVTVNGLPQVRITLAAERVEIIDQIQGVPRTTSLGTLGEFIRSHQS